MLAIQPRKNIYLIRHAESMCNVYHSQFLNNDKGVVNPALSELGIKQAIELNKKVKHIKFDLVIVSPLRRTKETCHYANLNYDNLITCKLCREGKYGICELMEKEIKPGMISLNNKELKFESEEDFNHRVEVFKQYLNNLMFELFEDNSQTSKPVIKVNELKKEYNIAVFSHSGFITALTSKEINGKKVGYQLKNAEYVVLHM
jgi:broad specificity phosphatase PhoE